MVIGRFMTCYAKETAQGDLHILVFKSEKDGENTTIS